MSKFCYLVDRKRMRNQSNELLLLDMGLFFFMLVGVLQDEILEYANCETWKVN